MRSPQAYVLTTTSLGSGINGIVAFAILEYKVQASRSMVFVCASQRLPRNSLGM